MRSTQVSKPSNRRGLAVHLYQDALIKARHSVFQPVQRLLALLVLSLLTACGGNSGSTTPTSTAPSLTGWDQGKGPFTLEKGSGKTFQNTAKFNSDGLVSYSVANSGSAKATVNADDGKVTLGSDAGSVTVTATVAAKGSYGSGTASYNITISNVPPNAVTLAVTTAKTYGDGDFSPATCGSGSPSYKSDKETVASVIGGQVHIVAVGSATILATCAGNGSTTADGTSSTSLTVAKKTPTLTFSNPVTSLIVAGSDVTNTATVGGLATGDPSTTAACGSQSYSSSNTSAATVSSTGVVHAVAPGQSQISSSCTGSSNYGAVSTSYTLTVANAPTPVLSFSQAGPVTVARNGSVTNRATSSVTATGAGAITYACTSGCTGITVTGDTVAVGQTAAIGDTKITATQAAVTGINQVASASYTLTVLDVPTPSYTWADGAVVSKGSGSGSYTNTLTASVNGTACTSTTCTAISYSISPAAATGTAVTAFDTTTGVVTIGTTSSNASYTITATQAAKTGVHGAGTTGYTLNVAKALLPKVTFFQNNGFSDTESDSQTLNYGANPQAVTATCTASDSAKPYTGVVTYTNSDDTVATRGSGGTLTIKKPGTTTITATCPAYSPSGGAYSYAAATRTYLVTVNQAVPIVRALLWSDGSSAFYFSDSPSKTLTARFSACSGCVTPTGDITISSSDESVIAVTNVATATSSTDRQGTATLTAKAVGNAKITISYPGDSYYKAATNSVDLTVAAALAAPSTFTATPATQQVTLSWSAVTGATSYKLLRGSTQVGGNITATTYIDTGLTANTTYKYSLKSCNVGGCSVTPVTASVTTLSPSVVTLNPNRGTAGSTTQVTVDAGGTVPVSTSGLPKRLGYFVGGWNTQADGNGTNFVFGTTTVTANLTIYAQWVAVRVPHSGVTASQCYASSSNTLVACSGSTTLNGQQDGHRTSVNAMSYSLVGSYTKEECVKDDLTGLIWEGKTASGDRAGSNTYNPDTRSYTSRASDYVGRVNDAKLCGYSDWRLPTRQELRTLVDYSKSSGATINSTWFPNTASNFYWSSSIRLDNASYGFGVDFSTGSVTSKVNNGNYAVRLVRTGQ